MGNRENLIGFTDEEFDQILKYMDSVKVETVQEAIMHAIKQGVFRGDIVRCKDCKHWVPGRITDTDDFIPPRCMDNHGVGWRAEDWCSFGVKWEDENAADRG